MAELVPYLFFDGNCREAVDFYKSCFGGDLQVMTFGDAQGESCPAAQRNKVMHAALTRGAMRLMASDDPEGHPQFGNNVHVTVDCSSVAEIETLFNAVAKGARDKRDLQDTFWGARFGTVTDRFGVHWMFNCDLKQGKK